MHAWLSTYLLIKKKWRAEREKKTGLKGIQAATIMQSWQTKRYTNQGTLLPRFPCIKCLSPKINWIVPYNLKYNSGSSSLARRGRRSCLTQVRWTLLNNWNFLAWLPNTKILPIYTPHPQYRLHLSVALSRTRIWHASSSQIHLGPEYMQDSG